MTIPEHNGNPASTFDRLRAGPEWPTIGVPSGRASLPAQERNGRFPMGENARKGLAGAARVLRLGAMAALGLGVVVFLFALYTVNRTGRQLSA